MSGSSDMTPPAERRVVHVIVPDAIDDPLRPSGGNHYDRKICDGLRAGGWDVREHLIPDAWPRLGAIGTAAVAQRVSEIPDDAVVVVDGLIAEASAPVLVHAARRLALAVLIHAVPPKSSGVGAALAVGRTVIATSEWVRAGLLHTYALQPAAVAVAAPGVEQRAPASGTASGGELLCVGSVARHKGQDVLLAALTGIGHDGWRCECVGSLDYDPTFAGQVLQQSERAGLLERVTFAGARTGSELDERFDSADVLVHPAREEGYGMVVTEALARGLPVITTTAGGLTEALGAAPDGVTPGLLVAPDDSDALAQAICAWLTDDRLRRHLRAAARSRRTVLPGWAMTVTQIATTLGALR